MSDICTTPTPQPPANGRFIGEASASAVLPSPAAELSHGDPAAAGASSSGLQPISRAMRAGLLAQLETRERIMERALETAHSLSLIIDGRERKVRDRRFGARGFQAQLLASDRRLFKAALDEATAAMVLVQTMRKMLGLPKHPSIALPKDAA